MAILRLGRPFYDCDEIKISLDYEEIAVYLIVKETENRRGFGGGSYTREVDKLISKEEAYNILSKLDLRYTLQNEMRGCQLIVDKDGFHIKETSSVNEDYERKYYLEYKELWYNICNTKQSKLHSIRDKKRKLRGFLFLLNLLLFYSLVYL